VAGTVLTLVLGNILWLFAASPLVPAMGWAFVLRNTIGKTRQLVMTAQQKFYAFNITQRGLMELQDALDDTLDRAHKAAEEVTEVERRFDLLTRIGRDCFRQLDDSVALINESGLRELDRARGILEEILTGYENLRSLVKLDEPFKEIADLDPANLLVDHEERRIGLQQRIKHLSAELVGRDKFVEQSESYIRDIRGERERLSGIDRDIGALGITDEQEPTVKKAILETDLKIEQLSREIEQNQRDIKRIQAQADEAGFIEQKRREIIAEIDRDLIHFYELREATRDIDCTDEKFAGLKNQLDAAEQMVAGSRGKINNLDAQRKIIQKDLERVRDVQTEIDGIASEARAIEDAILKYRELGTLFQSAGQDIKKRLVPQIESYFAWIMPRLTRGRYHQIRLSDDFDISVYSEEKQDFVNLDALSGGTMDQLLISLRLAFARAATSGDYYSNQFLFLDEPISSFDESRRELFFDLLETLKSGFQQIFLISHLPNLEEFTDAYIHVNLDTTPQPAVISWK
jgi:DNA repair exonuclease SbcCD ATPase subunit